MDKQKFAIAIDGPVAAGKGTIAARLAKELSAFHLYTGAMYRCLALFCLSRGIELSDFEKVEAVIPEVVLEFRDGLVILNHADVTERIKEQDTANGASLVGTYPKVRSQMVAKQQQIVKQVVSEGKIVVLEGRDTGTKIAPDAPLKVYLTANDQTRAERRLSQYRDQGRDVRFEEVLAEIQLRDKRDTERFFDPLPSDPEKRGYFILDNSKMNEGQTVEAIKGELIKRGLINK